MVLEASNCPPLSESPIFPLLVFCSSAEVEDFTIPEKWSRFLPAGTILIAVFLPSECDVDPAVPSVSEPLLMPRTASHAEPFSLKWS